MPWICAPEISKLNPDNADVASGKIKSISGNPTTISDEYLLSTMTSKLLRMDKLSLVRKCENLLAERRAFNRDSLSFRKMFWRVALAKEKKRNKELSSLIQLKSTDVSARALDNSLAAAQFNPPRAARCVGSAVCCVTGAVVPTGWYCCTGSSVADCSTKDAWTAHYWDLRGALSQILGTASSPPASTAATDVQGYRLSDMFKVNPKWPRVGQTICKDQKKSVVHPVVLIPGIISSGLELCGVMRTQHTLSAEVLGYIFDAGKIGHGPIVLA